MKICVIYNFAHHYRAGIFQQIDSTYDCDFFFGDSYSNVKKMDYSLLNGNVTEIHNIRWKQFYFQKDVLKLLKKDYDCYLIFSQIWCISTWLFLFLAKLKHKSVYAWSHGWYGKEKPFGKWLKKRLYKMPKGIFLYGNYARGLMIKEGFDANRLFTIHNSLEYDKQVEMRKSLSPNTVYSSHFVNDYPTLIFVGRLTSVKRLDLIIEAMHINEQKGIHYNLVLVGDGQIKTELQEMASRYGLQDNVWFYGACYDEQLLGSLIYNADLCVAPGNIGLTAMHCMVYGTPAITHNDYKWQMPEFEAIVPGVTGDFFERGSADAVAEVMNRWFAANGNKREEIRQACMKEIDENWNPYFQIQVLKQNMKP